MATSVSSLVFSCKNGKIFSNNVNEFCNFAVWPSANAYSAANYSNYNNNMPLNVVERNDIAYQLYQSYVSQLPTLTLQTSVQQCDDAVQRFSCVQVFPFCPSSSSSLSNGYGYYNPCKLHCEQVNSLCYASVNCQQYPEKNCGVYIPNGYFILSVDQGPYDNLTILYSCVFATWIIMLGIWLYLTYVAYRNRCARVCKFLAVIPMLKVTDLTIALAFWSVCNTDKMCNFSLSVVYINIHLIFETAQMFGIIILAKGWTIIRQRFHSEEWRSIIISLAAFYMSSSLITLLSTTVLNESSYLVLTGILYGSLYLYIFFSLEREIQKLFTNSSYLRQYMSPVITNPMREKNFMYTILLVSVIILFSIEVISNLLVELKYQYFKVLIFYEVTSMMVYLTLGWTFRPREYSPFFFMEPTRHIDQRNRPIPVLEIDDPDHEEGEQTNGRDLRGDSPSPSFSSWNRFRHPPHPVTSVNSLAEVELGPLLVRNLDQDRLTMGNNQEAMNEESERLIVVKSPSRDYSLGLSSPS